MTYVKRDIMGKNFHNNIQKNLPSTIMRTSPYIVLICLLSAYISGQWSRFSLAYLSGVAVSQCSDVCKGETLPLCQSKPGSSSECDFCYSNNSAAKYNLKQATCLSESEYSFLVSYGFIAFFATCGLFAGRLADQTNRRNVVAFACLGWSLATFIQSSSTNFGTLLVSRILMGLFTSFSAPASYSILADTFEPSYLATANGIYSLGVYLGGGLSSLSIVMAHSLGWRLASSVIACVGILSFVLITGFVSEPIRKAISHREREQQQHEPVRHISFRESLRIAFSDVVILVIFIAASTRFMGGFALGAYLPQFYKRKFPDFNSEYSVLNAFVVSFAGGISSISGGRLADIAETRFGSYACGLIPAIGSLLGLFPILGSLYVDDFYTSVFFLFVSYLLVECWFGPALKIIQSRMRKEVRGFTISIYLFSGSMIGNISPIIVGWLDDGASFIFR